MLSGSFSLLLLPLPLSLSVCLYSCDTWDIVSSAGSTKGLEHLSGFALHTVHFAPLYFPHTSDLLSYYVLSQGFAALYHDVMSQAESCWWTEVQSFSLFSLLKAVAPCGYSLICLINLNC